MIKIPKGVILPEALLIIDAATVVVAAGGRPRLTVGEVKVFPDRGGHTDPQQLASARAQAGVYRHALEISVASLGLGDDLDIAPDGFLVFTWPGSNAPAVRVGEDLTYQAIRAERGFRRLEEVAASVVRDEDFSADNPTLIQRVLDAPTDYSEACLSFCDLAPRCHARAVEEDDSIVLGGEVKRLRPPPTRRSTGGQRRAATGEAPTASTRSCLVLGDFLPVGNPRRNRVRRRVARRVEDRLRRGPKDAVSSAPDVVAREQIGFALDGWQADRHVDADAFGVRYAGDQRPERGLCDDDRGTRRSEDDPDPASSVPVDAKRGSVGHA